MSPWSSRQLAALGAVVATVLFVVGFLILGSAPKFNADALKIVGYFHGKHKRILVSVVLVEIAVAILVAVVAQLAMMLRESGHRSQAAVVGIAGAASIGSFAVGYALLGGLSQLSTFAPPDSLAVPPLYRLVQFIQVAWFWTACVLVLAVAVSAAKGAFPQWVAAANGIIALLLVLGGLSVKGRGAFAAGTGGLPKLAGFAFVVWVLHLGWLFWSKRDAPAGSSG